MVKKIFKSYFNANPFIIHCFIFSPPQNPKKLKYILFQEEYIPFVPTKKLSINKT